MDFLDQLRMIPFQLESRKHSTCAKNTFFIRANTGKVEEESLPSSGKIGTGNMLTHQKRLEQDMTARLDFTAVDMLPQPARVLHISCETWLRNVDLYLLPPELRAPCPSIKTHAKRTSVPANQTISTQTQKRTRLHIKGHKAAIVPAPKLLATVNRCASALTSFGTCDGYIVTIFVCGFKRANRAHAHIHKHTSTSKQHVVKYLLSTER